MRVFAHGVAANNVTSGERHGAAGMAYISAGWRHLWRRRRAGEINTGAATGGENNGRVARICVYAGVAARSRVVAGVSGEDMATENNLLSVNKNGVAEAKPSTGMKSGGRGGVTIAHRAGIFEVSIMTGGSGSQRSCGLLGSSISAHSFRKASLGTMLRGLLLDSVLSVLYAAAMNAVAMFYRCCASVRNQHMYHQNIAHRHQNSKKNINGGKSALFCRRARVASRLRCAGQAGSRRRVRHLSLHGVALVAV